MKVIKIYNQSDPSPPEETGFYWARSTDSAYYNMIVEVRGKIPFLEMQGWDIDGIEGRAAMYGHPSRIESWGPKIERPKIP